MTDKLDNLTQSAVDKIYKHNVALKGSPDYRETRDIIRDALKTIRSKTRKEDAEIAKNSWGMCRFFDESDQDKWGEAYKKIMEDRVDGWNKAKDNIAQAILKKDEEKKA